MCSDEIPSLPVQDIIAKIVMDKELQKAVTLIELAPSPYFSILNIHLVDITVAAKFYEIPSLPFQDIENSKCRGRTDRQRETSVPPPPTHTHTQTQFAGV